MSDTRTIVLIGLSGAGKSTVARLLSERLGARALDLDAAIEGDAQARRGSDLRARGRSRVSPP